MKFSSLIFKVFLYLRLFRLCPLTCWQCRRPVFHRNIRYRTDDVARAREFIQGAGPDQTFPFPRPYCPKCFEKLGVEPYRWAAFSCAQRYQILKRFPTSWRHSGACLKSAPDDAYNPKPAGRSEAGCMPFYINWKLDPNEDKVLLSGGRTSPSVRW